MKRSRSRSCFNIVRKCVAFGVCCALLAALCLSAGAIGGNGLVEGQIGVVNNGIWQGNIEFISPTMVRGWGRKLSTTATIQAQVFVEDLCCPQNGIFKAISLDANEFRQDLYDAGVGSGSNRGRHGFSWNWDPTGYCAGHRLKFMVTLVSGNQNQWLCTDARADQRKFAITNSGGTEYKLIGGVGNAGQRKYWIDPAAVNANLTVSINDAKSMWVNSGMFNFAQTSTKSSAQVRFFYRGVPGPYATVTPAITDMFSSAGAKVNGTANWAWAEISMNSNSSAPFNMFNYEYRAATISHEWGHAMGLDHPHEWSVSFGKNELSYPTDRIMTPYPLRAVRHTSWLDLKSLQTVY
jgi:hypothetical protein